MNNINTNIKTFVNISDRILSRKQCSSSSYLKFLTPWNNRPPCRRAVYSTGYKKISWNNNFLSISFTNLSIRHIFFFLHTHKIVSKSSVFVFLCSKKNLQNVLKGTATNNLQYLFRLVNYFISLVFIIVVDVKKPKQTFHPRSRQFSKFFLAVLF